MKIRLLIVTAALFAIGSLTSCSGYDTKECEKLADKCEEGELNAADYEAMMEQMDGLLSFCEDKVEEMKSQESKSDKCDKFSELYDTDEFGYTVKFAYVLASAKQNGNLKGKQKETYKDLDIKSRYKKFGKAMDKQADKCDDEQSDYYKACNEARSNIDPSVFDEDED